MNIVEIYGLFLNDPHEFKRQIDDLPKGKALLFDHCEILNAVPNKSTVALYKAEGKYTMRLTAKIDYTGWNHALQALAEGEPVTFDDFLMLRRFMEELSFETESMTNVSTGALPPDECNLDSITDMSALSMPTGKAQAVLDYKAIQKELGKHVMGQDEALEAIAYQLALFGNKKTHKRPLSLYLYGDPGTGKSEAAKAVAPVMSKLGPHPYAVRWVDCNQLLEKDSINRVIGASQGFVGYEDEPILSCVVDNSHTCIIFDECDKCHASILTLLMGILDEGRSSAKKELPDHTHEYRFHDAIFIFTSNLRLNDSSQKRIGFASADEVESIHCENNAVEVSYREKPIEDETAAITKRIYHQTESARKALVASGMLREIASRIGCFCRFKPLDDTAKIRILAKMVIETAAEYHVRISYIAPEIMQALINASMTEDALTVRSFRGVIDGYLAASFAAASDVGDGLSVRLEGSIEAPQIIPA